MTKYEPLTESEIAIVGCKEGVDRIFNELLGLNLKELNEELYESLYCRHYTFFERFPRAVYFGVANEWIREHLAEFVNLEHQHRLLIPFLHRGVMRRFIDFLALSKEDQNHRFPFFAWFTNIGKPNLPLWPIQRQTLMKELRHMADTPPNVYSLPIFINGGVGYREGLVQVAKYLDYRIDISELLYKSTYCENF